MTERLEPRSDPRNEHLGGQPIDAHQLMRDLLGVRAAAVREAKLRFALELNARVRRVLADRATLTRDLESAVDGVIAAARPGDLVVVRTRSDEARGLLFVEIAHGEDVRRFDLPTAAPPSSAPSLRAAARCPTVLVVDDDPDALALVEQALGRRGYAVTTATTVKAALALTSSTRFDALVTDLRLPDGHGSELAAALQANGASRVGCAIAVSGDDAAASSEASGFAAHLTKPISITHLTETLNRLVPTAGSRPKVNG